MAAEGAEGGCRQRPCAAVHTLRRVVLTGGPGAGKTAALGILRRYLCPHVAVLPEAASVLFGGGFPRRPDDDSRRAAQRAIVRVQMELEALPEFNDNLAIALCDRGTVDGVAYWPGDARELFTQTGTTLEAQLARYDTVIHLRTPTEALGYNHDNTVRTESAVEAAVIDARIEQAWNGHPRRFVIESERDFLSKALHVLDIVRAVVPPCCR
jgi:predicted ATPase